MDTDEFRRCGTDMVNYVADYFDTLRSRPVMPYVQHGFLKKLIPEKAPHKAESYEDVKKDLEDVVLKGVSVLLDHFIMSLNTIIKLFLNCLVSIKFALHGKTIKIVHT